MAFKLVQGVSVEKYDTVHSAYSVDDNGIYATVSGDLIYPLLKELVKLLEEPVFFFIEIPCSEIKEKEVRKSKSDPLHYDLYYLDNCTLSVAEAILKRYGQILINDGLCRFGFGSHKTEEEIYCMKYQTFSLYGKTEKFGSVFKRFDIPCESDFATLWDTFSNDSPGISSAVEINGETVYDIVENLKSEGLYLSGVIEE